MMDEFVLEVVQLSLEDSGLLAAEVTLETTRPIRSPIWLEPLALRAHSDSGQPVRQGSPGRG